MTIICTCKAALIVHYLSIIPFCNYCVCDKECTECVPPDQSSSCPNLTLQRISHAIRHYTVVTVRSGTDMSDIEIYSRVSESCMCWLICQR